MTRAFACLALAGLAVLPGRAFAQDIPDALMKNALVVRIHAILPAAPESSGEAGAPSGSAGAPPSGSAPPAAEANRGKEWQADSAKYTVPGNPAPFRLIGSNLAVIVRITPFENPDGQGLTLVAQGQVWVRLPEGGLSYRTTIDTLSVNYGESVLFYPLGLGPEGSSPLRLEITVVRAEDYTPPDGSIQAPADKPGK